MDRFTVEVISQTTNPQQTIYAAMHQDYAEGFVAHEREKWPSEARSGELIIRNLLRGGRGHYGPLEHPQMVLNIGWFPHSTMQQIRTHRVGISFDVQCLAGETEVTFVHASGALRKIKIAELYDLWQNGEKAVRERKIKGRRGEPPGKYRRDCKQRLRAMRLRVLNEASGLFETSHIQEVMCSGLQPVYRLTFEDGRTLDCTTNHRLLTTDGWQTMRQATGLETAPNGDVLAITRPCSVLANGIVAAGRGVYLCKDCHEYIHQNHLEADFAENFQPITEPSSWNPKPKPKGRKLRAHPLKIIRVDYSGVQMTYDLQVKEPWHNFVANGLVVHNSFRYTGRRILDVVEGKRDVEEVFYLRPLGQYSDRQGKKYEYTADQRQQDIEWCLEASRRYKQKIEQGFAEEHARGLIPFDIRQHWVMSANVRSLMHLLDLRWKADAQLEAQKMCEAIWPHFQAWVPAIAAWYEETRLKKAKLAP
jgi:thymidylate synthase (FAD)